MLPLTVTMTEASACAALTLVTWDTLTCGHGPCWKLSVLKRVTMDPIRANNHPAN